METILINKDKIKIMLTRYDMQKYHINCDFTGSSNEAEFKIWSILDDISSVTNFNTQKGSFYVQMFPSKAGGCELFVSRINVSSAKDIQKAEKGNKNINKDYIYKFEELSNMLSVCKALSAANADGKALAYYDKCYDTYYLTLNFDSFYPAEFFGIKCKSTTSSYLSEHCQIISDDALNTLSKLAL